MYCAKDLGSGLVAVSCDTVDALIVMSRNELGQLSPFAMDTESALRIGGAMLTSMAVAWVLRLARISLGAVDSAKGD